MTYKPSPSDLVQMPALGSDWTKDKSKRDKDWEGKDTLIDKTKWLDRKQKIRSKKQVGKFEFNRKINLAMTAKSSSVQPKTSIITFIIKDLSSAGNPVNRRQRLELGLS
ncbi:uncharacterized protein PGTG_04667 [Puccinia graminis f. sp. tritici CRL 75-36-700-3]|uniref:Uncharacterized protein n=1 Tax=Puccinia graminis f. sp. tritici (strain CRL 75-36-700-3 / race SCCL) TaxID=418459 RepID=E3K3Q9_PUCGT|nr:uncharacterized protein PGTG_04667 [Puccinia graminis f. sp. tritici CRL 75-36-700-3]EFP78711.2 hypothetical protein PGTG_04667 [Puccinia graminis f. sp. tritici CRL 75-36-700-3]